MYPNHLWECLTKGIVLLNIFVRLVWSDPMGNDYFFSSGYGIIQIRESDSNNEN